MKTTLLVALLILTGMTDQASACNTPNAWTLDASFGMAQYANVSYHDGQTAIGRLSLGYVLGSLPFGQLGTEIGIQNGNSMRLALPKDAIDALGGVPIEAQMKPMLDVLVSLKTAPIDNLPLHLWFKGGAAYRNLQLDRSSVPDLSRFSPEVQVGAGYEMTEHASITLGYQYISGKKPELTINALNETGVLRNMPSQQALMIGLSWQF